MSWNSIVLNGTWGFRLNYIFDQVFKKIIFWNFKGGVLSFLLKIVAKTTLQMEGSIPMALISFNHLLENIGCSWLGQILTLTWNSTFTFSIVSKIPNFKVIVLPKKVFTNICKEVRKFVDILSYDWLVGFL